MGAEASDLKRSWRQALTVILATFVASRLLLVAIAAIVELALPLAGARPGFTSRPVLSSLTGGDAVFLLGIAADGYHAAPLHGLYLDWAFFPFYPVVVRVVSVLTFGDLAVAGLLVSNVATLAASWLLYRLGVPRLGHRRALLAVVYALIAPGAVAFGMAYTDSLFLALTLAAVLAAERGRWGMMGIAYGLATITRVPGIILGVPLLFVVLSAGKPTWRALLPLALGPLALAGFTYYLWNRFGVWFAFLQAQTPWIKPASSASSGALPTGILPLEILLVATAGIYLFSLVYARVDRLDRASLAYVGVSLLLLLGAQRLLSVERYLAVVWPFNWLFAKRGNFVSVIWPAVSGGLFALFALLHFSGVLAP